MCVCVWGGGVLLRCTQAAESARSSVSSVSFRFCSCCSTGPKPSRRQGLADRGQSPSRIWNFTKMSPLESERVGAKTGSGRVPLDRLQLHTYSSLSKQSVLFVHFAPLRNLLPAAYQISALHPPPPPTNPPGTLHFSHRMKV